ncbi:MFS transporter [Streptomyces roseirectus]|uniref:MFS transporter n=1 Tax=Streptomyces roseirectus TaxID=2768066 RepID=A0A7H0ICT4_9ACTN|nr:MFS transporter [Streptomyces roseirectus]QNP70600.1 MFS transporter [Streptomyces roseirectus]
MSDTVRRHYVTNTALFWLPIGLAVAPQVLLLTERGLTPAAIAGLVAVHSLTAAGLELPTGGLSDVLGRRVILAAAGILMCAGFLLLGLATAPVAAGVAMGLKGAARALSSGPAEAWYVDSVRARQGPDADLRTGLAHGATASSVALAVGTVVGGVLPWALDGHGDGLKEATGGAVIPLSLPMLLAALLALAFTAHSLLALREPPRPRTTLGAVLRGVPGTVADGVRLAGRDAVVRRVLLTSAAAGTALAVIELLTPGRVAALTGAAESGAVGYAGLATAGFLASACGSRLAPVLWGGRRAVLLGTGVAAGALVLLGAGPNAVALAGYGLFYVALGVANPNLNELLHRRVPDDRRATALSLESLALQLAGAVSGLVAGAVAGGGVLPWLLPFGSVLVMALLWARSLREVTVREPVSAGGQGQRGSGPA